MIVELPPLPGFEGHRWSEWWVKGGVFVHRRCGDCGVHVSSGDAATPKLLTVVP